MTVGLSDCGEQPYSELRSTLTQSGVGGHANEGGRGGIPPNPSARVGTGGTDVPVMTRPNSWASVAKFARAVKGSWLTDLIAGGGTRVGQEGLLQRRSSQWNSVWRMMSGTNNWL